MTEQVRISYLIMVDGYVSRHDGEVSIHKDSWDTLKEHHQAIGEFYINCNPAGGDPDNARQILASRGARFTETK